MNILQKSPTLTRHTPEKITPFILPFTDSGQSNCRLQSDLVNFSIRDEDRALIIVPLN